MAYTDIDDPTIYFNTKLYTGTGSSLANTGVGFQPDWVWIKGRSGATEHVLTDSVRGVTEELNSNDNTIEETVAQGLTAFGSDGFTVGTDGSYNTSSATYASWNWKAGGTASSNTDGSITSSVSANQDAGFSIVSWSGTGSNGTIGHGLGSAPQVVLLKERNGTNNWLMSHQPLSASLGDYTRFITLNSDAAVSGAGNVVFQGSAFTSSYFNVGTSVGSNRSGGTYIGYVFAEKQGYSKFGSYTGNGNADGTFVYTGFKPAFVITKESSGTSHWIIHDTKRSPNNEMRKELYPNLSNAEAENLRYIDCLSNGFKIRSDDDTQINGSGSTYIYMAIAENPFVTSTGVPATAR